MLLAIAGAVLALFSFEEDEINREYERYRLNKMKEIAELSSIKEKV